MDLIWIMWMLVIGFGSGTIARFLMPGVDNAGFFTTTVLGITGSLLAGVFCQRFAIDNNDHIFSFVASVIGSLVILALFKVLDRKRKFI